MNKLYTPDELADWQKKALKKGRRLGLVPTMGALHRGHLALVEVARRECDLVMASVFVNPTQFNSPEDLQNYPRSEEEDLQALEKAGCNAAFLPSVPMLYPEEPRTRFSFGALEEGMEGLHRPGHFSGVALVLSKLFHLTQPQMAFFGQKDWQQYCIVRQLVADLQFPLEVRAVPTVREENGLALSSRNRRLSEEGYRKAARIYAALQAAEAEWHRQQTPAAAQTAFALTLKEEEGLADEYFEIAEAYSLRPMKAYTPEQVVMATAVYCEGVRLIDNLLTNAPQE